MEIRRCVTSSGKDVFGEWLARLKDVRARAKIVIRIDRVASGNLGDCKPLRAGVCELRIDWGPGYGVYYAMLGSTCVLLLAGGDKRKQAQDIERAIAYFGDYKKKDGHMKRKASISHDEALIRELRAHPRFAAEYLKAALEEDSEPRVLLLALRRVVQARGIAKIAKTAGVKRESLYRALSTRGNPRLSTLAAVTKAVGLRLTVEAAR
jgi:putative addiction module killer protein/probable addiction module antidote protein